MTTINHNNAVSGETVREAAMHMTVQRLIEHVPTRDKFGHASADLARLLTYLATEVGAIARAATEATPTDDRPATRYAQFFWVSGGSEEGDREYHWDSRCPHLRVELSTGAAFQVDIRPPSGARDDEWVVAMIDDWEPAFPPKLVLAPTGPARGSGRGGGERSLCRLCELNGPNPDLIVDSGSPEWCEHCGHQALAHHLDSAGNQPCRAAPTAVDRASDGSILQAGGRIPCRCSDFQPGQELGRPDGQLQSLGFVQVGESSQRLGRTPGDHERVTYECDRCGDQFPTEAGYYNHQCPYDPDLIEHPDNPVFGSGAPPAI